MELTKFHQQREQDPQGDLEGLPDVVVVEGQHGESLLVSGGVGLLMRVLLSHRTPAGFVAPRSNTSTLGGDGEEKQQ